MDTDDPSTPLLGVTPNRRRNVVSKFCGVNSWRRRFPITIWLPKYKLEYLPRDFIAGVTVALTSIPQGIAYAMIAGLPPQVGLYSSIFPGFVYCILGSCKDVTVGPTAILSALIAKYVILSEDFAYLIAFLSGCLILLLGVLKLGFLLDLISKPVISGFTTAAALQISASQLKSLLRVDGKSGSFITSVVSLFSNISTIHLWDSVLGVSTILVLILMKYIPVPSSPRSIISHILVSIVRARNAVVVFAAAIVAYCLYLYGLTPFALTGTISGGLPQFRLPPFETSVGNRTVYFGEMLSTLGPESLAIPLVAVLESIAIAKAFAGSKSVDCSQEMLCVGACNVVSCCWGAMPATGSFTRTALNHHTGVATQLGAFFKASIVLLGVTLLSDAFYFIPRSTLAAVIIVAMFSIIDLTIVPVLWRNSKCELCVWCVCVCVGALASLEGALAAAAAADTLRVIARAYHTRTFIQIHTVCNTECIILSYVGDAQYASASKVHRELSRVTQPVIVIDGRRLDHVDIGVAESIISALKEHTYNNRTFILWNFKPQHEQLFIDISPEIAHRFVNNTNYSVKDIVEHICMVPRL